MLDDRLTSTRSPAQRGLSAPATFLVALLALATIVAGLQFLPAQSGTPAYAEGVTTTEPTPYLEPVPNPPDPPLTNTSKLTAEEVRYVETWLFYYVNQERIRRGIDPLVRHDGLDLIARNRSYDMGVRDYFGHKDPDGGFAINNELHRADFEWCDGHSENIGATRYGVNTSSAQHPKTIAQIPRELTRGFMYSTPHRDASLSQNYDVIGFGAYAEDDLVYATMVLCDVGELNGSRYYDNRVTPAIKHPEWLPAETRHFVRYDYNIDGSESVDSPVWIDDVETLTPIPNSSDN